MSKKRMKLNTDEFDAKFENEDISDDLDWDNATKTTKRVNIDFPLWMVKALDTEADRLQIPRQAVIKMWLDERLTEKGAG